MGGTAPEHPGDGVWGGCGRSGGGFGAGWSFRHRGKYKGAGYKNKGLPGGVRGVP